MIKKHINCMEVLQYEAPSAKSLDIQSEGLLCVSGDFTLGGGGTYEDGDINDNGEY